MKHFLLILASITIIVKTNAQVVSSCPLNLSFVNGWPIYMSAPSHDVLWAAMLGNTMGGPFNCHIVTHTSDGGNTWQLDTIPETVSRGGIAAFAVNDTTVYIGLTDILGNTNGGAIWKTTDNGNTWTKQTTNTQFAGNYLDYLCFFSPDSGVAFADPIGGSYEIYTTSNGGATWVQVPSSNIPSPLPGEWGNAGTTYGHAGKRVWFATSHGRTIYSFDKGYTWSASVISASYSYVGIVMNDTINGVGYNQGNALANVQITHDGGLTFQQQLLSPQVSIGSIGAVKDVPGAFIFISSAGNGYYATTDYFTSYVQISNPASVVSSQLFVFDETLAWAAASINNMDSAINKITNAITGISEPNQNSNKYSLNVFPNPVTADGALITYKLNQNCEVIISLCDLTGKTIRESKQLCNPGKNAVTYDFKNIPSGLYFLKLDDGLNRVTQKVVVKK